MKPVPPLRRLAVPLLAVVALASQAAATACRRAPDSSRPVADSRTVRTFGPADVPITRTGVVADDGGFKVDAPAVGSVRLWEVPGDALCDSCALFFRADLRGEKLQGPAILEMWVRIPGRGEFFSKGFSDPVTGTTGWASHEVPFMLRPGEKPDLVKLNVAFGGPGGSLWIKDAQLRVAPLAGAP